MCIMESWGNGECIEVHWDHNVNLGGVTTVVAYDILVSSKMKGWWLLGLKITEIQ